VCSFLEKKMLVYIGVEVDLDKVERAIKFYRTIVHDPEYFCISRAMQKRLEKRSRKN